MNKEVSKLKFSNDREYNIKDSQARDEINTLGGALATEKDKIINLQNSVDDHTVRLDIIESDTTSIESNLNNLSNTVDDLIPTVDNIKNNKIIYLYPLGLTDHTSVINQALIDYEVVYLTSGTYFVDALTSIEFNDNNSLIGVGHVEVKVIPNDQNSYSAFKIYLKENVTIQNINLLGERVEHDPSLGGEWGFGIDIRGSKNVLIDRCKITDMWGDGLYIGDGNKTGGITNQLITIKNSIFDNNRRQGISVITANQLLIDNCILQNTNGTSPEAGIDFEPNYDNQMIKNCVVQNTKSLNNAGGGFLVVLEHVSNSVNKSDIKFINCSDDGSLNGFQIAYYKGSTKTNIQASQMIFRNSKQQAIKMVNVNGEALICTFTDVTIDGANQTSVGSSNYFDSLVFVRNTEATIKGGGLFIDKLDIPTITGITNFIFTFIDSNATNHLVNCGITNIMRCPLPTGKTMTWENVTDFKADNTWPPAITASNYVMNIDKFVDLIQADTTASSLSVTVVAGMPVGTEFSVQHYAGTNQANLRMQSGEILLPLNTTTGIVSGVRGSLVRIKKMTSSVWTIVNQVGTWTEIA